jgi:hypothetical protein
MNQALLINFKQTDTAFGVRRDTLKAAAKKLGVSETSAVHIAINRLYADLFPASEDFPTKDTIQTHNTQYANKGGGSLMETLLPIENSILAALITDPADRLKIQQAATAEDKHALIKAVIKQSE